MSKPKSNAPVNQETVKLIRRQAKLRADLDAKRTEYAESSAKLMDTPNGVLMAARAYIRAADKAKAAQAAKEPEVTTEPSSEDTSPHEPEVAVDPSLA
jgi:hypothetical protein